MCNLSHGIVDDTEAKIIMNMYESKFSLEQISLYWYERQVNIARRGQYV